MYNVPVVQPPAISGAAVVEQEPVAVAAVGVGGGNGGSLMRLRGPAPTFQIICLSCTSKPSYHTEL